jgi:hypothetical protein
MHEGQREESPVIAEVFGVARDLIQKPASFSVASGSRYQGDESQGAAFRT